VHLDARLHFVEEGDVAPLARHEVAADQAVQVDQRIAIEGRRDAEPVVVGRLEDGARLDQVDADQQPPPLARWRTRVRKASASSGVKLPMLEPG
jgi:hypothetical protein